MTINNILFVSIYLIWAYIIVVLFARVLWDRFRRGTYYRRKRYIRFYFEKLKYRKYRHKRYRDKVESYLGDIRLFAYACGIYEKCRFSYKVEERKQHEGFLNSLLQKHMAEKGENQKILSMIQALVKEWSSEKIKGDAV